jgi:hypothetical protein
MNINPNDITRELHDAGLSKLAAHQKEQGFRVPEGYFNQFSQSLNKRIESENHTISKPATKFFNLKTTLSMAASFLVIIALSISFVLLRQGKEEGFLTDYDDQFIDEYFAIATQFDRTLLLDLIIESDLPEPAQAKPLNGEEDDFLLDYLLDATQYYGIEPVELITQNGFDNQR